MGAPPLVSWWLMENSINSVTLLPILQYSYFMPFFNMLYDVSETDAGAKRESVEIDVFCS